MAAKAKAAPAPKKAAAAKKVTKAKAKPKGLQASNAAAKNLTQIFATGFRKSRLLAAQSILKSYRTTQAQARASSVAANAARMSLKQSRLAHQNIALRNRISASTVRQTTLLGRLQFAQAGEKKYATRAVMRTVTQAQAVSYELSLNRKITKAASKISKYSTPTPKVTNRSSGYGTGLSGARGSTQTAASSKGRAANIKTNRKAAASSKKAPAKTAKTRTAPRTEAAMTTTPVGAWAGAYAAAMYGGYPGEVPKVTGSRQEWVGNEFTPNCIVTAIANHMLQAKNVRVTQKQVEELTELAGDKPTIESVLWEVWRTGWPGKVMRLTNYREIEDHGDYLEDETEDRVIGFEVLTDDGWQDHCALSRPRNKVISWGTETDRESLIEEAWELTWHI